MATQTTTSSADAFYKQLGRMYGTYTGGFLAFIVFLALLEQVGVFGAPLLDAVAHAGEEVTETFPEPRVRRVLRGPPDAVGDVPGLVLVVAEEFLSPLDDRLKLVGGGVQTAAGETLAMCRRLSAQVVTRASNVHRSRRPPIGQVA